jgi:hypothetical protein
VPARATYAFLNLTISPLTISPQRQQPRWGSPTRVRRVRGCPLGNRGADEPPQEAPFGTSSGAPCRAPGPHGPGVAFRHPRSAICVPLQAAAFRMVWTGEDQTPQARTALCLSAVTGSAPLLALCVETVTASLLDLEPSRSPSRRRPPARRMRMAPPTSRRNRRRPNFAHRGASGISLAPLRADVLRLALPPCQRLRQLQDGQAFYDWIAALAPTRRRTLDVTQDPGACNAGSAGWRAYSRLPGLASGGGCSVARRASHA